MTACSSFGCNSDRGGQIYDFRFMISYYISILYTYYCILTTAF